LHASVRRYGTGNWAQIKGDSEFSKIVSRDDIDTYDNDKDDDDGDDHDDDDDDDDDDRDVC